MARVLWVQVTLDVNAHVRATIGGWGRQKCELIYCGSSEVDHIETGEICHDILFKKTTFSILFSRHLPRLTLCFYGPTKECTSMCEHYEVIWSSSFICRIVMISAILSGQHVFFGTAVFKVNYFDFQNLHDLFQLLINPWLGHGNDVFQEGFWFQFSPGFLWMLRKRHLRCSCTCGGIIPKNVEYFTSNCMLLSRLWATYHRSRNSFQTAPGHAQHFEQLCCSGCSSTFPLTCRGSLSAVLLCTAGSFETAT